uniref:Putative ovule protein n=1 Tax=Solanum chacoense TaxID=4108 RepID=A0A0V0HFK9_SOLCH
MIYTKNDLHQYIHTHVKQNKTGTFLWHEAERSYFHKRKRKTNIGTFMWHNARKLVTPMMQKTCVFDIGSLDRS